MIISIIEITVATLLIIGLFNEERVAKWEEKNIFKNFQKKTLDK